MVEICVLPTMWMYLQITDRIRIEYKQMTRYLKYGINNCQEKLQLNSSLSISIHFLLKFWILTLEMQDFLDNGQFDRNMRMVFRNYVEVCPFEPDSKLMRVAIL